MCRVPIAKIEHLFEFLAVRRSLRMLHGEVDRLCTIDQSVALRFMENSHIPSFRSHLHNGAALRTSHGTRERLQTGFSSDPTPESRARQPRALSVSPGNFAEFPPDPYIIRDVHTIWFADGLHSRPPARRLGSWAYFVADVFVGQRVVRESLVRTGRAYLSTGKGHKSTAFCSSVVESPKGRSSLY